MIVVDSSALVAIAYREPERNAFLAVLERADASFLAPISYVETGVILMQRGLFADQHGLLDWLAGMGVQHRQDIELGASALEAYRRYGKGRHPARLNLADCFAYALAKALDAPLLYTGDDFALTDIRPAL